MKRLIKIAVLFLAIVPGGLWLIVLGIGALQPETYSSREATYPKAIPRAGYEIIYPNVYTMGPDRGSFYYVSNKRQIVYRYDANRYLELQGENCEGLIWYHDDINNIHTRIDEVFYTADKLPKFKYFNPGKEYIAIPTQDLSSVMFSLDGGKRFYKAEVTSYAAVPGEQVERFIGADDKPLTVYHSVAKQTNIFEYYQKPITISGNTGYFILNNDILFGGTVFYETLIDTEQNFHALSQLMEKQDQHTRIDGKYWEIYHNPAYIERIKNAKNIQVEPYQGWDRIRCEIGAEK